MRITCTPYLPHTDPSESLPSPGFFLPARATHTHVVCPPSSLTIILKLPCLLQAHSSPGHVFLPGRTRSSCCWLNPASPLVLPCPSHPTRGCALLCASSVPLPAADPHCSGASCVPLLSTQAQVTRGSSQLLSPVCWAPSLSTDILRCTDLEVPGKLYHPPKKNPITNRCRGPRWIFQLPHP